MNLQYDLRPCLHYYETPFILVVRITRRDRRFKEGRRISLSFNEVSLQSMAHHLGFLLKLGRWNPQSNKPYNEVFCTLYKILEHAPFHFLL